ncbi:MAG TPA: type IV-A pilus assembly ATPase PilB [Thiobacillaceae bacterium]|nr:type IV-A pilus assembly ATPase PilB [Thiobacillaceae bacterium]HNA81892.1 type IV-A pilus assembly ATPase PilB [Thiobacillaceae bacterium]HNF88166.1 type IV-A pilus assembly ATPase PilB [Thiobacillaceae bacterium]HNH88415.1 type IV-A pilus assembly ATPase PilB [Thiobacillaceae bacterium]
MVAVTVGANLTGLCRAMVTQGLLTPEEGENLQNQSRTSGETFIAHLLRTRRFRADQIAAFASLNFGIPLFNLDALDLSILPKGVVDAKLLTTHRVLPIAQRGNRLFVALSDPSNLKALDDIKFQTNLATEPIVVEDDKLGRMLESHGEATEESILRTIETEDLNLEFSDDEAQNAADTAAAVDIDDAPVVKYLQKMLMDAINAGASDIHFEPYEKNYRIRYRMDGMLYEVAQPPLAIKEKIASRIKVISKLDISEKRVPQDGRMKLVLSRSKAVDFRVSTLPTLYGEKIVMRILDSTSATMGIEKLGYEPDQLKLLLEAVQRPYGMVLVTGPTGSGKTVSLYACLNILNQPGVNISTVEDPVEIQLTGINQVNVNEKAGLDFASAMKAFLRQDPDIIMVGEIRDHETGDIAIKAAQTGHMVLSTLHTNDAPATLTRLINMGIPSYNVAASVNLITAQRLGRRLCSQCKKPIDIPPEALLNAGFSEADLDGSWQPYGAVGCPACKDTGYKGRVGIYQVMPVSEEINRIILKNGTAVEIADQARLEGVLNLREAGLLKVKQGYTSLEEVLAVTNE